MDGHQQGRSSSPCVATKVPQSGSHSSSYETFRMLSRAKCSYVQYLETPEQTSQQTRWYRNIALISKMLFQENITSTCFRNL
jgi:hypothetical protein